MRHLERQITTAQRRLWVNRWLADLARFTACAGLLFAIIVLVQRLYDAPIPLMWVAVGMGTLALAGSIVCTVVRREDRSIAAARLDEAAGLRERLSSGQYCLDSDDPFARAVVADAEGRCAGLSARRHIRLRAPGMLSWAAGSFILSALMFLVSPGLLKRNEALADASSAEIQETKVAVKKQLKAVKKLVESIPALEDLQGQLDELDVASDSKLMRPSELRHAAIKKMDALADAIKKKRESDEMQSARAMRKMMRGLQTPSSTQSATRKLAEALKQGDFKKAQEEIESLKQTLSTLKSDEDRKMAEQVGKQLEALSKQLEQLARNESLAKKLEQMGLSQANVEKLLKSASKEDLEKLAKKLSDKGMNQQQIQSIKNQVRQQQQSGPLAQKLAEALGKSASSAQAGKMGQSMAGLAMAGEQLGDIEMLEQQMNDLNSAMSQLQNAKDNLDKPGSKGQGSGGMAGRKGSGGGMGSKPGQGRGGLAGESPSGVAFQTQRGKVHTGKGAIIGQFRVDGEQVKGEVTEEMSELISASHRDATDRISRDRLPRQYHKAVKSYFSTASEKFRKAASGKNPNPEKKKAAQAKPDVSEE